MGYVTRRLISQEKSPFTVTMLRTASLLVLALLQSSHGQQSGDPNVVSVGDWVTGSPAQLEARDGNVVQVGDWVTVGDSSQPDWRQNTGQQGPV